MTTTFSFHGTKAFPVEVFVQPTEGTTSFLGNAPHIKETQFRVRSAIIESGLRWPVPAIVSVDSPLKQSNCLVK